MSTRANALQMLRRDHRDMVASVEHDAAKQLAGEIESGDGGDGLHRQALVHALHEMIGHHMHEEEQQIFPVVEKLGVDLDALGEEMLAFGMQMLTQPQAQEQAGAEASTGCRPHSREEDEAFRKTYLPRLSGSTQRAKWIYSPDEHEDFPGQTLATRNPEVIRRWADERKAHAATIPGADPERPRVLRFDFPNYAEDLEPVSWDAWCAVFEHRQVVFLFQEHLKSGRVSNFFAFDSPFREDA